MNKYQKYYDLVFEQSKEYDKTQNCKIGQTWEYHLLPVVKNAIFLAEKYGADKDVVEVAAIFHDYANLIDYNNSDKHHVLGADLARSILEKDNFDNKFIEKVCKSIISHRASVVMGKFSIEEVCVADADAMAHLYNVVELLMWRGYLNEEVEKANNFVKNKIKKSYAKMSDKTKELLKERYDSILSILY